jgi:hypothetical protein
MHTKHEKEEGILSLCLIAGLFIIGRLLGGNKIIAPRVLTLFDEQGKDLSGNIVTTPKMRMSPLPSNPPFIHSSLISLSYPIPEADRATHDLYSRVTAPLPEVSPLVQ